MYIRKQQICKLRIKICDIYNRSLNAKLLTVYKINRILHMLDDARKTLNNMFCHHRMNLRFQTSSYEIKFQFWYLYKNAYNKEPKMYSENQTMIQMCKIMATKQHSTQLMSSLCVTSSDTVNYYHDFDNGTHFRFFTLIS